MERLIVRDIDAKLDAMERLVAQLAAGRRQIAS